MKTFKVLTLAVSLCAAIPAQAQIAVVDPGALVQWSFQIMEMKAQYEQMLEDFELATESFELSERDFESRTGSRGLGTVDYNSALSGMIANPSTVFNGNAASQQVMQEEQVLSGSIDQQRQIEERSLRTAAARKAASQQAYEGALSRLAQIESLMSRISQTQDQKAIEELQGRIMAEQAVLQNEQNRHQILMQAAQAEDALITEQKRGYARKILNPSNSAMPGLK